MDGDELLDFGLRRTEQNKTDSEEPPRTNIYAPVYAEEEEEEDALALWAVRTDDGDEATLASFTSFDTGGQGDDGDEFDLYADIAVAHTGTDDETYQEVNCPCYLLCRG